MKYSCDKCNYTTNDGGSWSKHIKTNKHIINNENDILFPCIYCNKIFTRKWNMEKHILVCKKRDEIYDELIDKYEQIRKNNIKLKIDKKYLAKHAQILESNNTHYQKITENANTAVQKSLSTMNYLVQKKYEPHYLIPFDPKLLQGNKDIIQFARIILNKYIHYNLAHFIGDSLIAFYKKDDPKDQSIWNSDSARLNYVIRDVDEHGGSRWTVDKHAVKVKELLIQPLLTKIYNAMNIFVTHNFSNDEIKDKTLIFDVLEKQAKAYEIIEKIKDTTIETDVINYITPPLHLKRN